MRYLGEACDYVCLLSSYICFGLRNLGLVGVDEDDELFVGVFLRGVLCIEFLFFC